MQQVLHQACSTVSIMKDPSAKIGLHADNMKFIAHNEEWIITRIIRPIRIILPAYICLYIMCNKNIPKII